jgi:hypothetical protein
MNFYGEQMATSFLHTVQRIAVPLLLAAMFLLAVPGRQAAAGNEQDRLTVGGFPAAEALRLGERMYRDGVLPSGEALQAHIRDDVPVDSTAFSCASCHMRAGLGSIEGGVTTPPTNGSKLYQPYYKGALFTQTARTAKNQYVITPKLRQAYTDETLATALREGINPAGKPLDDVMPRYFLADKEMAILLHYLKALSAEASPGVDARTLHLATIVTEGVSAEDRQAMLAPLQEFVALRNSQAKVYEVRAKYMGRGGLAEASDLAYRKLSLAVWELKGPPESWRRQLLEQYRRQPVFALVGGIAAGSWQPVHEFCEAEQLPCLFPITDFPVVSEKDWYTLYFDKGFHQEGEAAARYLGRSDELSPAMTVVQIVRDSSPGRALAAGFELAWQEQGRKPPVKILLKEGEMFAPELFQQLQATYKPAVLLVWAGDEALPAVEKLAASADRPELVVASSRYLQKALWQLSDKAREMTRFTYPYRLDQDEKRLKSTATLQVTSPQYRNNDKRIATRVYSLVQILQLGLMHMERNFYRDNLLDVLGMIPDQVLPDYERLSFGPGQRYASKGCYIVQLTAGPDPELVRKSDWVVH